MNNSQSGRASIHDLGKASIPIEPIRANTYQPVAKGPCPRCRTPGDLQFCYNPYGDDDLICSVCAEKQANYFDQIGNFRP